MVLGDLFFRSFWGVWVGYISNKIPIYPIFHLLKEDYKLVRKDDLGSLMLSAATWTYSLGIKPLKTQATRQPSSVRKDRQKNDKATSCSFLVLEGEWGGGGSIKQLSYNTHIYFGSFPPTVTVTTRGFRTYNPP